MRQSGKHLQLTRESEDTVFRKIKLDNIKVILLGCEMGQGEGGGEMLQTV